MTREEEIITACKGFLAAYPNIDQAGLSIDFLDGAKWADKHPVNVWHDANEEPKKGEDIIALDIDGISVSGVYKDYTGKGIYRYHCFLCEWDAVVKWAYISDLLPKGGGK